MCLNGHVRIKSGDFKGQTGTIIHLKESEMIVVVRFDKPDSRLLSRQMIFWRYMLESIP
jgi:hypothetical protein